MKKERLKFLLILFVFSHLKRTQIANVLEDSIKENTLNLEE